MTFFESTLTARQFIEREVDVGHKYNYMYVDIPSVIGEEYDKAFHQFQDSFEVSAGPKLLYTEEEGFGLERDHHVTQFYGMLDDCYEQLCEFAKTMQPFPITLKRIEAFVGAETDAPYDVLKVGVESEGLQRIFEFLDKNFNHEWSYPYYKPHMTIAYVRPGTGEMFEGIKLPFSDQTFMVDKIMYLDKQENLREVNFSLSSN